MNNFHEKIYKDLEDITPYLRSLGIERTDKVISLPDGSFNISLYLNVNLSFEVQTCQEKNCHGYSFSYPTKKYKRILLL